MTGQGWWGGAGGAGCSPKILMALPMLDRMELYLYLSRRPLYRFPPSGIGLKWKPLAKAELVSSEVLDSGWIHNVSRFTLEVEGADKPCCVADSVGRLLPD